MTSPGPLGQEISLSWWVYNNALLFMQGFIQDFLVGGGGGGEHWSLASTRSKGLSNALFAVKCICFHQNNYCIDEKTKKKVGL